MEESDAGVVTRAREGDSDAFRLLVDRHGRSIFRLAWRMTGSEQDAEDLVQETFLRGSPGRNWGNSAGASMPRASFSSCASSARA